MIDDTKKALVRFQDKFWLSNGKLAYQMVITKGVPVILLLFVRINQMATANEDQVYNC